MELKTKSYNVKLWKEILSIGKLKEKGQVNKLDQDDLTTIYATMDFFQATDIWLKQTLFDLKTCKYRVFDWLAMCLMSRNDDNRQQNEQALKVLIFSYLKAKGNVIDFIADLRATDYDIIKDYEQIEIDV